LLPNLMNKENEMPSVDGDDEKEPCDDRIVLGKRMEYMAESHDEAAEMCKAVGAEWTLCLIDDLMSGQLYFQEAVEEEMTITSRRPRLRLPKMCRERHTKYNEQKCEEWCNIARKNPAQIAWCAKKFPGEDRRRLGSETSLDFVAESYAVWVHDQCEPFSMFTADDIIEYEAVAMTAEFNASNEGTTAAIDSDSMLIGAGIGAVVMLLVVGLFAMIMKWRKNTAKGQESDMGQVVDAPNVVHVEDDSVEVAKAEGAATVEVVDAEVPTPAGAAVIVAV